MNLKIIIPLLIGIVLISLILFFYISDFLIEKKMKKENTDNIVIENNEVDLDSLTLRQKIAQMIIVGGDDEKNLEMLNFNVGGIFLDKQKLEEDYGNLIKKYQKSSKIKLLVATDLEGAWNPFSNFKKFPKFSDVKNKEEAFQVGLEQGGILKKLGFNLNFAPVAEFKDKVYGGRAFLGTKQEIKEKLAEYIRGLQSGVLGTCKHYPGKGMIKNLHNQRASQQISSEDLELFEVCFKNNISTVMMGHQIVSGYVNSASKPSSISKNVIKSLGNFDGLIISDEVNMQGIKSFYFLNKNLMYRDLINSGEDIILDFKLKPRNAYKLILDIEKQVKEGKISEEKINESVKKILKVKGYKTK